MQPTEEGPGLPTRRASQHQLDSLRIPIPPLEAPSKSSAPQTRHNREIEMINGEYGIDITGYFKLLSSDVAKTIFEEEY
jgi:hypothetical protein